MPAGKINFVRKKNERMSQKENDGSDKSLKAVFSRESFPRFYVISMKFPASKRDLCPFEV